MRSCARQPRKVASSLLSSLLAINGFVPFLMNVAAHHDRLEYVCQRGMLTRDVVRLVDNGVCVCAGCNRAAASRRAGLAQW